MNIQYLKNTAATIERFKAMEEDIYVFDVSMRWCVICTHKNDHWEAELEAPMKAARSRFCLIYRN